MKDFWKKVEDFLTNVPSVVLWIMLVAGLCIPNSVGCIFAMITIVLFCFQKKN